MNTNKSWNRDYYFKAFKFVRDLVHDYVFLTKFELSLIDTVEFQRLKDIRQLTCQHVYPGARHTRFEHSLGVMELTRCAVDSLNQNGFISGKKFNGFSDELRFNAILAALLHDVGHCPFSHLGEKEFNKDEIWDKLYESVERRLPNCSLMLQFHSLKRNDPLEEKRPDAMSEKDKRKRRPGAVHEQLSCIMILNNLYDRLARVEEDTGGSLCVDFELLCRCILGSEYETTAELYERSITEYQLNQEKNVIVHLISAHAFDMDKLDYIMRDSFMTGLGTPTIDTQRLFRNMYLSDNYSLVFTSRAVPALQNMVDARDGLYMYVYNHHAVVFSDFMNTYIFRRLAHNSRDFRLLLNSTLKQASLFWPKAGNAQPKDVTVEYDITSLGMVPKRYLFSWESVLEENRSDSDLYSLLNIIYCGLLRNGSDREDDTLLKSLVGELHFELASFGLNQKKRDYIQELLLLQNNKNCSKVLAKETNQLISNIRRSFRLIARYMRRDYLKPWWKTYSEFNLFLSLNFPSDTVRRNLCAWICNDQNDNPEGDEFRSQLAKHVSYITKRIAKDHSSLDLLCPLQDGEFFVIERSARFFEPETLKEVEIAQKINETLGAPGSIKYQTGEHYIKELPEIIPQKDYYSIYAKNSFYIFSKRLDTKYDWSYAQKKRHYQLIEQIFIFVATTLVNRGANDFCSKFGKTVSRTNKRKNERQSKREIYEQFVNSYLRSERSVKRLVLRIKKRKG